MAASLIYNKAARSKAAVVYLLFFTSLALLLSLGGWQWRRGVEKAAIETLLEETSSKIRKNHSENDPKNNYTTIDRAPPNWSELAYRQVRLEGNWRAGQVFLMDNRTHRGRLGYEVFSPFRLAGDRATLLVNRGWISRAEASATDALKPDMLDHAAVRGRLYLPQKGFVLGQAYSEPPPEQPAWPKVIQYFDAPALSIVLGTTLQPPVLVLDADHPAAFVQIWQAYTMTATRHFGYAAQWWGLAVTLLVFGVIWRRRSTRSSGRPQ